MSAMYKNTDLLSALAQKLSGIESIAAMGTAEAVLVPLWEDERPARQWWEKFVAVFGASFTDVACLKVRYSTGSGFDITGVSSSDILDRMDPAEVVSMIVRAIKTNYSRSHGWEAAIEAALAAVDEMDVDSI